MCNHRICNHLRGQGATGGAGVLPLKKYYHENGDVTDVVALGRECDGQYAEQFNLFCGKQESHHNGCFLATAAAELYEEGCIYAGYQGGNSDSSSISWRELDEVFKSVNGQLNYIIHYRTVIFLIMLSDNASRQTYKQEMAQRQYNRQLDHCYREMDDFEWFKASVDRDEIVQLEDQNVRITDFAKAVISKVSNGEFESW